MQDPVTNTLPPERSTMKYLVKPLPAIKDLVFSAEGNERGCFVHKDSNFAESTQSDEAMLQVHLLL